LCRSDDGEFVVDDACLAVALDRGGFARVWRRSVSTDEVAAIRESLVRRGGATERRRADAH